MKGLGYVGYGVVNREAEMVRQFVPEGQSQPLLSLPLKQPNLGENKDDADLCEWPVGVSWQKTFSRDDAKKYPGIFANPNIVCALRDAATVEFLSREFGLE